MRVALWRAMHLHVDPPPHVLEDKIGLRLAAPGDGWLNRQDMDRHGTARFRAWIVARATAATMRQAAELPGGSTLVMTFMLPIDLVDPEERQVTQWAAAGARASGTPFISLFSPDEAVALARDCGFHDVRHISTAELTGRYFANRPDGLRPASGEQLLMATV